MRVLKKGRPQKGWAKELDCSGAGNGGGGCGARLLVEEDDLYTTNSFSLGEENGPFITFMCVSCGCETDVVDRMIDTHALPTRPRWLDRHTEFKMKKRTP